MDTVQKMAMENHFCTCQENNHDQIILRSDNAIPPIDVPHTCESTQMATAEEPSVLLSRTGGFDDDQTRKEIHFLRWPQLKIVL